MLRLRSLSSQLQQPQLAKGRSDVRALFFIKHLQLKSLLKQVEAGELEMIGINWRSENRVEHRFIIASSSLHHRFIIASSSLQPFTFKGSSGSPKRGGCGLLAEV
jgi:hypothetical protein